MLIADVLIHVHYGYIACKYIGPKHIFLTLGVSSYMHDPRTHKHCIVSMHAMCT